MKRNILTALAVLGFVLNVSAQENFTTKSEEDKGYFLIGGAITYWNNTKENQWFSTCVRNLHTLTIRGVWECLLAERERATHNVNHTLNAFKISPLHDILLSQEPFSLYLTVVSG